MATWMGITWEIQQSAPTDALKVVFTLISLTDSDTRSLWLDPGMQTHANKTHKTLMYKKKKKKKATLLFTLNSRGIRLLNVQQPESALSPWEGKWPEGSLVGMEAEQVELITQDSSTKWREALQLSTTGLSTCQAGWMDASTWQVLLVRQCSVGYHNN